MAVKQQFIRQNSNKHSTAELQCQCIHGESRAPWRPTSNKCPEDEPIVPGPGNEKEDEDEDEVIRILYQYGNWNRSWILGRFWDNEVVDAHIFQFLKGLIKWG
ncbi:hypothetical protein FNV43_RR22899 [Rhamnella rubrinervis]|uniref:Uncharacterized protein n=1 Tax=Rhamnella rubrinervis TaxID=2594499 RepID=A0A8K0GNM1_9ROSA|nr:hypothetical protein FNV43_RR22899 [Rhamnella rubrinervis]